MYFLAVDMACALFLVESSRGTFAYELTERERESSQYHLVLAGFGALRSLLQLRTWTEMVAESRPFTLTPTSSKVLHFESY